MNDSGQGFLFDLHDSNNDIQTLDVSLDRRNDLVALFPDEA